jgi:signal transduction histidine kinase/CheY-like chemotaxis protein
VSRVRQGAGSGAKRTPTAETLNSGGSSDDNREDMLANRVIRGVGAVVTWLPRGQAMPREAWSRRHRGLILLLWAHVPALLLFGALKDYSGWHAVLHLLPVVLLGLLGRWAAVPQRVQAVAVTLGLLTAAGVGVHLSGGVTESHFLFFVLLIALALYEDWLVFLLAIGFVVAHHGLAASVGLGDVYSHAGNAWLWAGVHGAFVLAAAALCVVSWRASEHARAELQVSERLKLESQLREAQKLESLGLLAGGLAHDFNNLLVGVLGNAALVLDELPPDSPLREQVEQIELAGQRAAGLTRQMLAYSGSGRLAIEPVEITPLVAEIVTLITAAISKQANLVLALDRESSTTVRGDSGQLSQVVMNLITNAAESLPGGVGSVSVSTGVEETAEGSFVAIEVADSGCGMDAETQARIFEPFYTTKFTGRGLGLAAVDGIVRSHGGRIDVRSAVGSGTTCRVLLPTVVAAPVAPEPAPAAAGKAARETGTILLVDDEPAVREVVRQVLERRGFSVLTAAGGLEAVQLFASFDVPVAAAIIDMSMPGLNGLETMRALRRVVPGLPIVLTSGYTTEALESGLPPDTWFIQKPYANEALLALLRDLIQPRPAAPVAA